MKKKIFMLLLLLSLCISLVFNGITIIKAIESQDHGEFKGVTYDDYILKTFPCDDLKIDEKLALKIGTAYLKHAYGKAIDGLEYDVYDNKNRDCFIIYRQPKNHEQLAGGDFGIAINKKDGKVLSIYGGF